MATNIAIKIGWAEVDITPNKPVLLRGQHPARLAKEVLDPLKVVAFVLQVGDEQAVMASCDLTKIILNATHTHTAPENSHPRFLY